MAKTVRRLIAAVGFLLWAGVASAAPPESIAFLEEHNVGPNTPHTVGAVYQVPFGRKAIVSGWFCEIRGLPGVGMAQILPVVITQRTVRGPATSTRGMNPIDCVNEGYVTRMTSSAAITLRAGDCVYAIYANYGTSNTFQLLNAMIYEEDEDEH